MSKPEQHHLEDYLHTLVIPTRWADNDVYGHINNSVYYFYFDTVVNKYLLDNGLLKIGKSKIVGLVVETSCSYFAPISFPDNVTAGLRITKLGNSSVRYEIGLFRNNETKASAQGHFVHVYVNETSRRPASLTDTMRTTLSALLVNG